MHFQNILVKPGYVYIISNRKRNVLYIGVTSDLVGRIWNHRNGNGSGFSKKYNLKYLVYYEEHPDIKSAIDREKQLKNWHHKWKLNLVKQLNPEMRDLWNEISR